MKRSRDAEPFGSKLANAVGSHVDFWQTRKADIDAIASDAVSSEECAQVFLAQIKNAIDRSQNILCKRYGLETVVRSNGGFGVVGDFSRLSPGQRHDAQLLAAKWHCFLMAWGHADMAFRQASDGERLRCAARAAIAVYRDLPAFLADLLDKGETSLREFAAFSLDGFVKPKLKVVGRRLGRALAADGGADLEAEILGVIPTTWANMPADLPLKDRVEKLVTDVGEIVTKDLRLEQGKKLGKKDNKKPILSLGRAERKSDKKPSDLQDKRHGVSPEEFVADEELRAEQSRHLQQGISKLSAADRHILELELTGLDGPQRAASLQISEPAERKRRSRAMKRLAGLLMVPNKP